MIERIENILANGRNVKAILSMPDHPKGLVIVVNGEAQSSRRDQLLSQLFIKEDIGTLRYSLSDFDEKTMEQSTPDIHRLSRRLISVTHWVHEKDVYRDLKLAYLGIGLGATAAIRAATAFGPSLIKSIVCVDGLTTQASGVYQRLKSPVLLIASPLNPRVVSDNKEMLNHITSKGQIESIGNSKNILIEPGKLEHIVHLATSWYNTHWEAKASEMVNNLMT